MDQVLSAMADNFRPFQAPAAMLPYLVRLSRARVEPSWPERAVRAAIDLAGWLSVHRGTPAGLLREARVVYGWSLVVTDSGGTRLPGDTAAWPADVRLCVELDPAVAGPDPIAYDQGTLERLIDAHLPVSSARVLAPPPGRCALYEGPYSTGRALVLSRDEADLAPLRFDNRTASVWNRTAGIVALYDDVAFGDSGGHQYVPAQQAVNMSEALTRRTSSVRFLTTVPDGSWGLFDDTDGKGNLLGVYDVSVPAVAQTVAAAAKSLVNKTNYTLEAFGAGLTPRQVVYPGVTATLATGLSQALATVKVNTEVPVGAFCLYERPRQGGKQWVMWTAAGDLADLTPIAAANQVSSVYNRTEYTVELFTAVDGTGSSQLFYPMTYAEVTTALDHRTNSVTVRNGPPSGYYCLYGGKDKAGRQWVFAEVANKNVVLTDPAITAANTVSSVFNNTSHTLELFKESNGTGVSQLFYPGLATNVTVAGLDRQAKAVQPYDGAPADYYCLYAGTNKTGKQWVFRDTALRVNLTDAAIAAGNAVACVDNRTSRTLEVFKDAAGTGTSQLVYPGKSANLASGLAALANSATVYNGPPSGYYCLYETRGAAGRQWVFPGTVGERSLTAADVGATGISEVRNATQYTLELFQSSTDASGLYQMCYPGRTTTMTTAFDDKATYAKLYNGAPDGYFCLYGTGPDMQWVFRGASGIEQNLVDISADLKVSRVVNKTQKTLELFQNTDATGGYQLIYPAKDVQVSSGLSKASRLVRCYDNCPQGYYCLYENGDQGGRQYVFRATIGEFDLRDANIDANDKVSSVRNLTRFTLQLFADPGPSGTQQYCYPSQTVNVRSDLNDRTTIVKLHDGAPSGGICLYEDGPTQGRQWILPGTANAEYDLTAIGAGGCISNVGNNTMYTLELYEWTNKTGLNQMFWPYRTTSADGGFNDRARYARLHDGARNILPRGYFCLFSNRDFLGVQWVVRGNPNTRIRAADIGAANAISSVGNNTTGTVRLFRNNSWSGDNWWTNGGDWHSIVQANMGWAWAKDFNDATVTFSWDQT
ncbi:peptidase inhibitor family I36 protein [Catenulispora yoronensis]|uniref:peptidase inhibitor family I36 protein n=1 Tax=Catenulispora yoronensis TaxID=450799 RepID=UPI0031D6314B